jgi:RNA polymerase sigma factor for flagellar operon FliA
MKDVTVADGEGKTQELVCQFLPYARSVARKMYSTRSHYSIPREEFDAAAYLGLCEAANRYDESRGIAFNAYCARRIRGAIIDMLRTEGFALRLTPEEKQEDQDNPEQHEVEHCEDNSPSECFESSPWQSTLPASVYSFFNSFCDRMGVRAHALPNDQGYDLSYTEALHPVVIAEKQELAARLIAAMGSLSGYEQEIIRRRYAEEQDFQSIAADCGMSSRSWAFRTHQRAIDKLRIELVD